MIIGSKLYRTFECADSMDWAKRNIETAPDGAVFLADKLTQAKGRGGRVWKIYDGQLNVTILLKPKNLREIFSDNLSIRINQLNMAVALGIYDVIKDFGVGIKFPNDFVIQSEGVRNLVGVTGSESSSLDKQVNKKVGGVLFHLVWEGSVPVGIVCGFSINVNNIFDKSDELSDIATSLAFVVGRKIEMRPLYKNLLISINHYYKKWQAGHYDEIYKFWRKSQLFMGKSIKIHQKNGEIIIGKMLQVLPNGDMLLVESSDVDKSGTGKFGKQKIVSFYIVEQVYLN